MRLFKDFYLYDKKAFIKILALTVLSGITGGVGAVMIIPMLNAMNIGESSRLYSLLAVLGLTSQTQKIIALLTVYLLCISVVAIINRAVTVENTRLSCDFTYHLRTNIYNAVINSDWQKFTSYKSGELINFVSYEVNRISFAARYSIELLAAIIKVTVNMIIAFVLNAPMTLVIMILGAGFLVLFSKIRRYSKSFGKKLQELNSRIVSETQNQIGGLREIRGYGATEEHSNIFSDILNEYKISRIRYAEISTLPSVLMSVFGAIIIIVMFLLAYYFFGMDIPEIAVLVYIVGRLWPSFSSIQANSQYVLEVSPVYENLLKITNDMALHSASGQDNHGFSEFHSSIEFNGISFSYRDSDTAILQDVSMKIEYGKVNAILGSSGAGKSTIISILSGFLSPVSGRISIDGRTVSDSEYRAFCTGFSYIPQNPLLINDTVRENLRRFHPKSTEDEMIDALKKAQIWDYISRLPDGLDTVIGDNGIRLSGGEGQRIVLARALVGHPQVIIMDEATNALDSENEKKIMDILYALRGHLTIVIVTHRRSAIKDADHFILVKDGSVSESDSFSGIIQNE